MTVFIFLKQNYCELPYILYVVIQYFIHKFHYMLLFVLDSSLYAHHVFHAFDANKNGSISFRVSSILYQNHRHMNHIYVFCIFQTFNNSGYISLLIPSLSQDMLVSLSTLLRGTTYEKLRWTFTLYDLNKDGFITKQEVTNVVLAVHELMGIHGSPQVHIFNKISLKRIKRGK